MTSQSRLKRLNIEKSSFFLAGLGLIIILFDGKTILLPSQEVIVGLLHLH